MNKPVSNSRNTSELAVAQVGNRFDLVLILAKRARELKAGHRAKVTDAGGVSATALMEVEQGLIGREYLKKVK
jgi:DNA-directed RNA polymerase subunit omega